MSIVTLVLGHSGHGKSTSMRNLSNDECFVFQGWAKPLPFKNDFSYVSQSNPKGNMFATKNYGAVIKYAERAVETGKKIIIIDDFQYFMANEFMQKAEEKGYDKFTILAKNVYTMITMLSAFPEDVRIYIMCHIEDMPDGFQKMKTIGKLLDEKITMEGLFTIVLKSVKDDEYGFRTKTNGTDTVKTPMGMFDSDVIENDLKAVDQKICDYYNIGGK